MAGQETAAYELCLDFSNTVDWRNGKDGRIAKDHVTTYVELVKWCKEKGLVGNRDAAQLAAAAGEGSRGAATLKRAIELREAIYRLLSASAHGKEPSGRDVEILNGFLASGVTRPRIVREAGKFQWEWNESGVANDKMLWAIARSAADLLTSEHVDKVRECANEDEGCGWLFLDHTKNHSKRWCDMSGCGNRAKVRRYYERHEKVAA